MTDQPSQTSPFPPTVPSISVIPVTVSYPASETGGTMTVFVQLGLAAFETATEETIKVDPKDVEIV